MKKIWIIFLTLGFLFLISFSLSKVEDNPKIVDSQIAVIPIKGVITVEGSGDFLSGNGASSTLVTSFIKQAENDENIKGIILEINSPGGGVVASEEIANAVKNTKKPTVAWIREVGASGAYWIASASDAIVADPLSITGSIGVISSYLEFGGFLEEHNVTYERLVSGNYKDTGTPFRTLQEDERDILQSKIDKVHDFFVSEVASNRDMEKEEVEKLSTGIFYLGSEAQELGLVDYLGGKDKVEEVMKEFTGLEDINFVSYQERRSFLDLFQSASAFNSFYIGKGIGSELSQQKEVTKKFELVA